MAKQMIVVAATKGVIGTARSGGKNCLNGSRSIRDGVGESMNNVDTVIWVLDPLDAVCGYDLGVRKIHSQGVPNPLRYV